MSDTPQVPQTTNRKHLVMLAVIITLVSTIVFLGLFALFSALTRSNGAAPISDAGNGFANVEGVEDFDGSSSYDPPRVIPEFTLTNHQGQPTSLSDFAGRHVLLFFGFTHCPDVCPLTLDEFRSVHEALGDTPNELEFVFVSVDGSRDTPEALGAYFERRGVTFVTGLTGTEEEVRGIGLNFNVEFFITPETAAQENYLITHTANSYLLNPDGDLVMRFAFGTEVSVMAGHIRERLGL